MSKGEKMYARAFIEPFTPLGESTVGKVHVVRNPIGTTQLNFVAHTGRSVLVEIAEGLFDIEAWIEMMKSESSSVTVERSFGTYADVAESPGTAVRFAFLVNPPKLSVMKGPASLWVFFDTLTVHCPFRTTVLFDQGTSW